MDSTAKQVPFKNHVLAFNPSRPKRGSKLLSVKRFRLSQNTNYGWCILNTHFKWNKILRCMVCLLIQHADNKTNENAWPHHLPPASGRAPPATAVSVAGNVADSRKVWKRQSGWQPYPKFRTPGTVLKMLLTVTNRHWWNVRCSTGCQWGGEEETRQDEWMNEWMNTCIYICLAANRQSPQRAGTPVWLLKVGVYVRMSECYNDVTLQIRSTSTMRPWQARGHANHRLQTTAFSQI